MRAVNFRSRLAQAAYDFLDVGKSPRPADCIFVPSGRKEPKDFGVKMWRFGYAPQLILGEVDRKPGQKTGFSMVRMDRQETTHTSVKGRSEARALAGYLRGQSVRSLLVLAPPVRVRRTALSFQRAFRKSGVQLTFVAVPEKFSLNSPQARAEVRSEFLRFLLCRLFPF